MVSRRHVLRTGGAALFGATAGCVADGGVGYVVTVDAVAEVTSVRIVE